MRSFSKSVRILATVGVATIALSTVGAQAATASTITSASGVSSFGPLLTSASDPVVFADPAVPAEIIRQQRLPMGSAITQGTMASITSLVLADAGITDLTGMEYATNLTELMLYGNEITDLAPLAHLPKLESLSLSRNKISDISELSTVSTLTHLELDNNTVSDLAPLASITGLEVLFIDNNEVSDLSPLADLPKFEYLVAPGNHITDISGFAKDRQFYLDVTNQKVTTPAAYVPRESSAYSGFIDSTQFSMIRGTGVTYTGPSFNGSVATWFGLTPHTTELTYAASSNTLGFNGYYSGYTASVNVPIVWSEITTTTVGAPVVDTPFSKQIEVTPGFPAETFSFVDGTVPGLSIDNTGMITGTPSTPGDYSVTVQAADIQGNIVSHVFAITVGDGAAPVVDPTDPVVDPTDPAVDPTDPAVDPANPAVDPTVSTPTDGNTSGTTDTAGASNGTADSLALTGANDGILLVMFGALTALLAGVVALGVSVRRRGL